MISAFDASDQAPDLTILYGDFVADPDVSPVEQLNRLATVVAAMRALLNDPQALMRRATELIEGTAAPLFTAAIVALGVTRMVAGPTVPGYLDLVPRHRSAAVAVAAVQYERGALA